MALAQTGTFSGPIVPSDLQSCPAGWPGFLSVLYNLIRFAIYLAIVMAVLAIAYAGFMWVINPVSPENRSTAKKALMNAAIGLVLTLSAWLIVNTLLLALGVPGGISGATSILGTSGGARCITATITGDNNKNNFTTPSGVAITPNASGTSDINVLSAAAYADKNAKPASTGYCAQYVREALAAGGYTDLNANHPPDAYQYGPYLTKDGFVPVASNGTSYSPKEGDVVVFQPVTGHDAGHIALYDGTQWVSDFKQKSMYASTDYITQKGSYVVYRPGS